MGDLWWSYRKGNDVHTIFDHKPELSAVGISNGPTGSFEQYRTTNIIERTYRNNGTVNRSVLGCKVEVAIVLVPMCDVDFSFAEKFSAAGGEDF